MKVIATAAAMLWLAALLAVDLIGSAWTAGAW